MEYGALEERAAQLERASEQMGAVTEDLWRIQQEESGVRWLQPPAAASAAMEELSTATYLLSRCRDAALEHAADLRTAAARYRDTEGRAERQYRQTGFLPSLSLLWLGRGAGGFPERDVAERLPLRFIDAAALKAATAAVSPGSRGLRTITVEKSQRSGERVQLDGSNAGLLNRSAVLLEENDPGIVEILRIEQEDGPVFVVTLPGTQAGDRTAGPNPFDNFGNAEGRAHHSRYIAAAVAEALKQAQAEAGDAVILVGYSQGGIHAANAAGQIQDATGVEVKYILTAGAPAGDADIPAGISTLHLEHQQDWVAGIDGTSNPDTPDRVTMTITDPAQGSQGGGGLGPAHKLPVYLEGAAAADASTDPSLRAAAAGVGAIVAPGSIAIRELYRFRRTPPRTAPKVVPRGLPPLPGRLIPPATPAMPVPPAVRRPLPFVPHRISVTGPPMPRPPRPPRP